MSGGPLRRFLRSLAGGLRGVVAEIMTIAVFSAIALIVAAVALRVF